MGRGTQDLCQGGDGDAGVDAGIFCVRWQSDLRALLWRRNYCVDDGGTYFGTLGSLARGVGTLGTVTVSCWFEGIGGLDIMGSG